MFSFVCLIFVPAGGSNPAWLKLNLFNNPAGIQNVSPTLRPYLNHFPSPAGKKNTFLSRDFNVTQIRHRNIFSTQPYGGL